MYAIRSYYEHARLDGADTGGQMLLAQPQPRQLTQGRRLGRSARGRQQHHQPIALRHRQLRRGGQRPIGRLAAVEQHHHARVITSYSIHYTKLYDHTIHASARTLLSLIENILDISKIEANKLTLEQAGFDLHALVSGLMAMLAPQAEAKGLTCSARVAPETPFLLMGDVVHP